MDLYRFAFKLDDPAFGRVPRAAARSPTRKRVPGRTQTYVKESDADTRKRVPGRYTLEGESVLEGLHELDTPALIADPPTILALTFEL